MTAMADYLETQIITHLFRTGTFTKPTVLAVALCTVAPVDADTGALTAKEVSTSGTAYGRQAVNPLDANWGLPTGANGTTTNVNAITFTAATADWSTVVAVAICDSTTAGAGNLLFYGTLTGNKIVNNGDTFQFAVGQLSIQIDN